MFHPEFCLTLDSQFLPLLYRVGNQANWGWGLGEYRGDLFSTMARRWSPRSGLISLCEFCRSKVRGLDNLRSPSGAPNDEALSENLSYGVMNTRLRGSFSITEADWPKLEARISTGLPAIHWLRSIAS